MSNDKADATFHPAHARIKNVSLVPEGEGFPGSHIEVTQSMDENDDTAIPPAHMDEH